MGIIIKGDVKGDVIGDGGVKNETHYHYGNEPQVDVKRGTEVVVDDANTIPDVLLSEVAQDIWCNLREAGFIVPDGYALAEGVSANQATYIADRMAERLGIERSKWKTFQQLWGIKNMAQLAGSWQQTGKLPPRATEIDRLT